jgi:hypothetical protein
MGAVWRAVEAGTGREVALKRLLRGSQAKPRNQRLFQREYHTLVQIQHPRVIEVYDYGVDDDGPYYAMELLQGSDLQALAPLSVRETCHHLRDVASSLALLHARRLVHRDVSPRNVRVTPDGRAKLLDFGAIAPFGVAGDVVGTPPCIAPESLRGEPLDGRTDLYALGALAYWLLTRRHAYPARELLDLAQMWGTPPRPPSALAADVPEALDALVMSLLDHEPLGRPSTAAEVIDRLNAIAGLEPESDLGVRRSYLHHPTLVGRDRDLQRIRRGVDGMLAGAGFSLLLEGETGVGRTRLLNDACIDAQLKGVTVLRVEASGQGTPLALAGALGAALLRVATEPALRAAEPHASLLVHLVPELGDRLSVTPEELPQDPGERLPRLQSAMADWILSTADVTPLLLAVDDVHRADDASVAHLTVLAHRSSEHHVGLLCTAPIGTDQDASSASRALRRASRRLRVRPLDRDQLHTLVQSMFGDVSYAGRLAQWLHERGGGNLLWIVETLQLLVDRGIIRYAEGTWALPQDPKDATVATDLSDVWTHRVQRLGPRARELADALSLTQGPHTLEQCEGLAPSSDGAVFALLDELVTTGVLVGAEEGYRFAHEALREWLAGQLPAEQGQRLHLRIAAHLERSYPDHPGMLVRAGHHRMRGGDESGGANIVARASMEFIEGVEGFHIRADVLEEALRVFERESRPLEDHLVLLHVMTGAGWFVDRRLAETYGDRMLDLATRQTGLGRARTWSRWLGAKPALIASMLLATVGHRLRKRRVVMSDRTFEQWVIDLVGSTACRAGVAFTCHDAEGIERCVQATEPFRHLGRLQFPAIIHDEQRRFLHVCHGELGQALRVGTDVEARLREPEVKAQVDDTQYRSFLAAAYLVLGTVEALRASHKALEYADRTEALGLTFWTARAYQVRELYYGIRGDVDLAARERRAVEQHVMQGGSTWQTEVFSAANAGIVMDLNRDVVGLKRAVDEIGRWAARVPSLRWHADAMEAQLALARGNLPEALQRYEALYDGTPPRSRLGWSHVYGQLARALNATGDHGRAQSVCEAALAAADPDDLQFGVYFLEPQRQLAMAVFGQGDAGAAVAMLESLLERYHDQGPALLSRIHESLARVALQRGRREELERRLATWEQLVSPTRNPGLIRAHRAVASEASTAFGASARTAGATDQGPGGEALGAVSTTALREELERCKTLEEKGERIVAVVAEVSGASSVYLYLLRDDDWELLAQSVEEAAPDWITERLRQATSTLRPDERTTATTSIDSGPPPSAGEETPRSFECIPLLLLQQKDLLIVGGMALGTTRGAILKPPGLGLREAIAECLRAG